MSGARVGAALVLAAVIVSQEIRVANLRERIEAMESAAEPPWPEVETPPVRQNVLRIQREGLGRG